MPPRAKYQQKNSKSRIYWRLALDGNLRGVSAILPVTLAARHDQKNLIMAHANAEEASLVVHEGAYSAGCLPRFVLIYVRIRPCNPYLNVLNIVDRA